MGREQARVGWKGQHPHSHTIANHFCCDGVPFRGRGREEKGGREGGTRTDRGREDQEVEEGMDEWRVERKGGREGRGTRGRWREGGIGLRTRVKECRNKWSKRK